MRKTGAHGALLGFKHTPTHNRHNRDNIPLRCSICDARAKTRQMFRYNRVIVDGHREGVLYMCCLCAFDEARRFLKGSPNCLISQGGADCRDQATLLVAILSRMRRPRGGFASECLAAMR